MGKFFFLKKKKKWIHIQMRLLIPCTSVRAGGGVGDILKLDDDHRGTGWRTGFEMSFFLVVVVILLNAIFGIIFDTFGHLRNGKVYIYCMRKVICVC
jgi:hypothetical protein